MSKIEEALRKARSGGALKVVSGGTPKQAEGDGGVAAIPFGKALVQKEPEMEGAVARTEATLAIARMRETTLLDRGGLEANRVIYREMDDSGVVEAFRQIRTAIIQKTDGRNAIVLITSIVPGGGSSFVAMNLGAAFALDAGKTALVVDCNLRGSGIHHFFGAERRKGLTDFMENMDVDVADIIHPVGIERLRVIPAGEPREIPAEHFTTSKMRRFLDGIRRRYRERYVILDAPPMTELADIQILTELCDLVIVVVPYGKVTGAQLAEGIAAIDQKRFFGVVFNGEPVVPSWLVRGEWGDFLSRLRARLVEVWGKWAGLLVRKFRAR